MDAGTKRRVEELSAEGWSQRAIAEAVGVSRGAVWRALRDSRDDVDVQPDDDADVGIGLVGGLIVVAVFFALVLISMWVDSRRRRSKRPPTIEPHRPPQAEEPPST